MRQPAARRRTDSLVVTVGRERSDNARNPKPSQRGHLTLVEKPSNAALRKIRIVVKQLKTWLHDVPVVKINGNASDSIINDVGIRQAALAPIAYDSNTRSVDINERCRFWDDPKKYMRQFHHYGMFSSADPRHMEMHEVGHAKHHYEQAALYDELKAMGGIWPGEPRGLATRLSDRAGESPIEFVAEFYAARRLQVVLDHELLAQLELLYQGFGGPSWE
jgi:hypothetical protein